MTTLYDDWPRSRTEQELYLTELERQVVRLESLTTPIVIHNFRLPTQSEWELAYLEQSSKDLPIEPGAYLCWVNVETGHTLLYTTAFDRDNGASSSGMVYAEGKIQNKSHFRFIGNMRYTGHWQNAETEQMHAMLGVNLEAWQMRRLLMIEGYFRILGEDADAFDITLSYGSKLAVYGQLDDGANDVVSVLRGDVTTATTIQSQTLEQDFDPFYTVLTAEAHDNADNDTMLTGYFQIYDPFGSLNTADEFEASKSGARMAGWLWHLDSAGNERFKSFTVSQFYRGNHLEPLAFGLIYQPNIGLTPDIANRARGWLYGWFADPVATIEEFPDGI